MRVNLRKFAPLGSRVFYPHAHEAAKGRSLEGLFLSPIMGLRVTNTRSQPLNLTRMPVGAIACSRMPSDVAATDPENYEKEFRPQW
jgi:hypothetical protein